MRDPQRWFDDSSTPALHRRLLGAAVPPPPLSPILHEQFSSFGAQLASGAAVGKVAAAPLAAKLFVVSATLSVGVLTGYAVTQPPPRSTSAQLASNQPPHHSAVELAASHPQPPILASSTADPQTASATPPALRANRSLSPREQPLNVASSNTIRDEAAMLERARRALSDSPLRALMIVDEHAERFKSGQLAVERELIAVQALVSLGRQGEAQQRASQFFTVYRSSVYQRRMRQILGNDAAPVEPPLGR